MGGELPLSRHEWRARGCLATGRHAICPSCAATAARARPTPSPVFSKASASRPWRCWPAAPLARGGRWPGAVRRHQRPFQGLRRVGGASLRHALLSPEEAEPLLRRPDTLLLDSRPAEEFRVMTIPGARNLPGGELALRAPRSSPRPDQPIVVHCAGRTRSILGAESLAPPWPAQSGFRPAQRHHGVGAIRAGVRTRAGGWLRSGPSAALAAAARGGRALCYRTRRAGDRARGGGGDPVRMTSAPALPAGCARSGGVPRRPLAGGGERPGRPAGAGDGPLGRGAACHADPAG